jgi:hypothetical protein
MQITTTASIAKWYLQPLLQQAIQKQQQSVAAASCKNNNEAMVTTSKSNNITNKSMFAIAGCNNRSGLWSFLTTIYVKVVVSMQLNPTATTTHQKQPPAKLHTRLHRLSQQQEVDYLLLLLVLFVSLATNKTNNNNNNNNNNKGDWKQTAL